MSGQRSRQGTRTAGLKARTQLSQMSAKRAGRLKAEGRYQAGSTFARAEPGRTARCRKVRYRDELAAKLALAKLERQDKEGHAERRAYECPRCNGWHLTSWRLAPARASAASDGANQGKYPGPPGSDLRVTEVAQPGQASRKTARQKPFPPKVAALLDARDEWCQRCGNPRHLERHHRRGKGSGGSAAAHVQCACNGIRLCHECHMRAHREGRGEAEAQGFVVRHGVAEPGSVGVIRGAEDSGGALMYPHCDGTWREWPQAGAA